MGNIGRYVCVALPFALTLGSLIAMLVAGLAGVADKNLYMFQVNTTNLTISENAIKNLISRDSIASRSPILDGFHPSDLLDDSSDSSTSNAGVKAVDLGLAELYDISLWGYCSTPKNGSRTCTKPAFNWAESAFNKTTSNVEALLTLSGQQVEIPKEVMDAINAFSTITRWTEIVFIIAYVALGVELFLGIFANCSRIFSCLTWIIAGVAAIAVCTAAALSTAMSVVVTGTLEGTAKAYGLHADVNTNFLAAVWIGAAFALASGFFWLFTICCCKPEHRMRGGRSKHTDEYGEKLIPGSYQPIHDGEHTGFYNSGGHAPQYGAPRYPAGGRSDLAYEPYSHHN